MRRVGEGTAALRLLAAILDSFGHADPPRLFLPLVRGFGGTFRPRAARA